MADPLSIITSIITLLDTANKVYGKVTDATRLPKAFQKINSKIDVAIGTLTEVKQRYEGSSPDQAEKLKIASTLKDCEDDAKELKEMYEIVCKAADSDWLHRYRMYIASLAHDRKRKVEEKWQSLLEGIKNLEAYHIFKNLSSAAEVAAAIQDIQGVEDSTGESHANFYGPVGNAHFGSGENHSIAWQNYGGSQQQFVGGQHTHQSKVVYEQKKEHPLRRQMLKLSDPSKHLSAIEAKQSAADGTCSWVLDSWQYRQWSSKFGSLAIAGHPGTGKTTVMAHLARSILDEAAAEPVSPQRRRFAYFFCDAQDRTRNNALAVVRGLLWQLCAEDIFMSFVQGAYDRYSEPQTGILNDFDELVLVLEKILNYPTATETCLLIDAVDECRGDLLGFLVRLFRRRSSGSSRSNNSAKLVFSCRLTYMPADSAFARPSWTVTLGHEETGNDVRVYVETKVKDLCVRKPYLEIMRNEIQQTVIERAGGIFLWASLALAQIENTSSREQASLLLIALPTGLSNMYDDILRKAPVELWEAVRFILHFMAAAQRKLQKSELLEAVLLYKKDWQITTNHDGIVECEALVWCRDLIREPENTKEVDFVHGSLREYLTTSPWKSDLRLARIYGLRIVITAAWLPYLIQDPKVLVLLFITGLALLITCTRGEDVYSEVVAMSSQPVALALYTVCPPQVRWMRMLLARIFFSFNEVEANFQVFRALFNSLSSPSQAEPHEAHGGELKRYASRYIHYHASKACYSVQDRFPWNTSLLSDNRHRTEVWLRGILESDNDLFLIRLLDSGIETNHVIAYTEQDCQWRATLLIHAARAANVPASQILLHRGAIVDSFDDRSMSALRFAIDRESLQLVRLLLEFGANPDLEDKTGKSTMFWALQKRVPAGQNGEFHNNSVFGNAFCFFGLTDHSDTMPGLQRWPSKKEVDSDSARQQIFTILIAITNQIDRLSANGDTLLMRAASRHEWAVVQDLLDRGADADILDPSGRSALHLALEVHRRRLNFSNFTISGNGRCFAGAVVIFEQVHHHEGKNSEQQDAPQQTFLNVVVRLIGATTKLDTKGESGRGLLSYAAENGHPEVVAALLERQVDVDVCDEEGMTALMWASKLSFPWTLNYDGISVSGNSRLSCGAIMLVPDGSSEHFQTEENSQIVLTRRHLTIDILLEHGADIERQCHDGRTPVMLAADDDLTDTVQFLYSRGARQNELGDEAILRRQHSFHGGDFESEDEELDSRLEPFRVRALVAHDRAKLHFSGAIRPDLGDSQFHDNVKALLGHIRREETQEEAKQMTRELAAVCPRVHISDVYMSGKSRAAIGMYNDDEMRSYGGAVFDQGLVPISRMRNISLTGKARWGCAVEAFEEWSLPHRPSLTHFQALPRCTFQNISVSGNGKLETCNSTVVFAKENAFSVDSQFPGNVYNGVHVSGNGRWNSTAFGASRLQGLRLHMIEAFILGSMFPAMTDQDRNTEVLDPPPEDENIATQSLDPGTDEAMLDEHNVVWDESIVLENPLPVPNEQDEHREEPNSKNYVEIVAKPGQ